MTKDYSFAHSLLELSFRKKFFPCDGFVSKIEQGGSHFDKISLVRCYKKSLPQRHIRYITRALERDGIYIKMYPVEDGYAFRAHAYGFEIVIGIKIDRELWRRCKRSKEYMRQLRAKYLANCRFLCSN